MGQAGLTVPDETMPSLGVLPMTADSKDFCNMESCETNFHIMDKVCCEWQADAR